MKHIKKQLVRKKEVDRIFNSFKKNDLLEDRAEYDEEDLKLACPQLNEKEAKLLYLKIQQWKYGKLKKNKHQNQTLNLVLTNTEQKINHILQDVDSSNCFFALSHQIRDKPHAQKFLI